MTKFYTTQEVAQILGLTPAEVNKLREEGKLHGYRDGLDWKFKAEDVERLQAEGIGESEASEELSEPDVLLSEVELGGAGSSKSGPVISEPPEGSAPEASDLQLAKSEELLAGPETSKDELDLVLEEDLILAESDVSSPQAASAEEKKPEEKKEADQEPTPVVEEEEVLIGGSSGSGSDVTMGADSGISLVDPSDSGLSLEEPIELGTGEEALELGEDDMITLADEEADLESPTQLRSEEFDLTGLEEGGEEEAESGSQVIALEEVEEAAPGGGGAPAGAPMLEEELVTGPAAGPMVTPFGAPPVPGPTEMAAPGLAPPALPEAPYTIWNVLSLGLCLVILAITGMMMFDLIRNIWSWDSETVLSSPIMDAIISLFHQ